MTRELADQIIADTPELERLGKELERAHAAWKQTPDKARRERLAETLTALSDHCHKMNAYMRPAADALEMLAPPRRKREKARR